MKYRYNNGMNEDEVEIIGVDLDSPTLNKETKMLPGAARDRRWMLEAIAAARRAADAGEVPVGALLVRNGRCLGRGWNHPIAGHDCTAHAEIIALRAASARLRNYRLPGSTLYVTLEPCVMCAGALLHARVARIVYGAPDPKAGAAGSVFNTLGADKLNHRITVTGGVLRAQCSALLLAFFRERRGARRRWTSG